MLIYIDYDGYITAWNTSISEVEAQPHLSSNCLWIDIDNLPHIEHREGFNAFHRYVNGEIVVSYEQQLESLTEQEQAILETALNVDYLVCLADLGL